MPIADAERPIAARHDSAREEQDRMQALEAKREITLVEVLIELALRKRLFAKVITLAVFIGLLFSLLLPTRFTATTRILPPRQAQSAISLFVSEFASSNASPLAALAGGGLGLKNPDDIYIGLLKSRPIADSIIQRFSLAKTYGVRDMTGTRKELSENTSIVSEKSGLVAISVTDSSKQRAAAMANAYTSQLSELTKSLAVTEASQRRLFYEEQLKQAKSGLAAAEYSFEQVQQQKGLVQPDAQARALITSLAALHAQVAAKQVELQALRSFSTEKNPSLQLAENQLSTLQTEVARLEERNHSSGSPELAIGDVPAASLDYLHAEHELRFQQTLFDLLLKQYEAARLDESREGAVIQVVEPAIEPDRKSSPQRVLIIFLSATAGFFLTAFYIVTSVALKRARLSPDTDRQLSALKAALHIKRMMY